MEKNIIKFRTVKKTDIQQVLEIYNFHIKNGLANFEEKTINYESFLNLSKNILKAKLPFIICELEKEIIGFAFLNHFREKSGYRYTYENSIYMDKNYLNKGYGNLLLKRLILDAKKNDKIKSIIAVIGSKNSKGSRRIHEKNGFNTIGTLKKVGYKKKQWLNSIYMQKIFNEKN